MGRGRGSGGRPGGRGGRSGGGRGGGRGRGRGRQPAPAQQQQPATPSGEALVVELRASPAFYAALQDAASPAAWVEGGPGGAPPLGASKLQLGEWATLDPLLRWFSKGLAADPQAELAFSQCLTKAQRASVHGTATAVGRGSLGTVSRGAGEARAVVVLAKERAERPVLDEAREQQAFWLWKWATDEGMQVSRDEVREAVQAGSLPPQLQAVSERRGAQQAAVRALVAAAAAGDVAGAQALVAQHPDLLAERVFDVATGVAPLHAAAASGQVAVVELLLAAGADANAADGHGNRALQVARRHDQSDAEGILLRAGAADPDANQWPGARRVNLPGNGAAAAQPAAQAAAASSSKAASGAADEGAADEAAAAQPHALPHVAVAPAGGEEDEGSLSSEEEEVMTSTAAAAEEAVAAFTAAVAAAEAAEAAAEEAEGMPGPEAAERATAFRREAEAAIVAAAAAAVVAGDSLDDVLPPRYEAPSSEPDAEPDQVAPLPAVPHVPVASSSVASVCGSDGPPLSLDFQDFASVASQEAASQEAASQADQASQDGSAASSAPAVPPAKPAARAAAAAGPKDRAADGGEVEEAAESAVTEGPAASAATAAGEDREGSDARAAGEAPAGGASSSAAGLQALASVVAEQAIAAGKQAAAAASDAAGRARAQLEERLPEWRSWAEERASEGKAWAEEHPGRVVAGVGIAAAAFAALLMLRK